MAIPESRIEETPAGRVPSGPGWFVLDLVGARGLATEGHGVFCPFEAPDARFSDFGINVHVLEPGERSALYHREAAQEGFLVLDGECIAVVEEQERTLRRWDYLHCPVGTAHAFVGAGAGPCAILMVGARRPDAAEYPVSAAAGRHGLSVPVASGVSKEAYASAGWPRESVAVPMPWPAS
jgi:mannose-6-phosphate isomerase-like protein (cupin superfamily)